MDKFPEVEIEGGITGAADSNGDFLSREKALLGEEGAKEFAGENGGLSADSDGEVAEFSSNYPSLDDGALPPSIDNAASDVEEASFNGAGASGIKSANGSNGPEAYVAKKVELSESEFLKDWKVKKDLEIERRDKVSEDKREDLRSKAHKSIDEFYENYNTKTASQLEKVKKDAEEFLKKRDEEIAGGSGTTWDHIAKLLNGLDGGVAEGVKPADKKRFKELVESLKGDVNAPGAGGY